MLLKNEENSMGNEAPNTPSHSLSGERGAQHALSFFKWGTRRPTRPPILQIGKETFNASPHRPSGVRGAHRALPLEIKGNHHAPSLSKQVMRCLTRPRIV